MGKVTTHDGGASELLPNMRQALGADDLGALHTHPSFGNQTGRPSPTDIGAAKASGKTNWTSGSDGLYSASPDGTVTQIYVDTN